MNILPRYTIRTLLVVTMLISVCLVLATIVYEVRQRRSLAQLEGGHRVQLERISASLDLAYLANSSDIPSSDPNEIREYLSIILPAAQFTYSEIEQISQLDCAERLVFWTNGHAFMMAREDLPKYCTFSRLNTVDRDKDGFPEYVSSEGNRVELHDNAIELNVNATHRMLRVTRSLRNALPSSGPVLRLQPKPTGAKGMSKQRGKGF